MEAGKLPYFDEILAEIDNAPQSALVRAFGNAHVHWGYFADPLTADTSPEGLIAAAEAMTLRLIELAGVASGQAVLDVGCGFGGTVASLNAAFEDVELVGVNIDDRQLERARARVQPRPGNRVEFVQGDACALPLAAERFDTVMAVECIFHFPSRERFLAEAFRVLRPGGTLVVSDFVPHGPALPILVPWTLYAGKHLVAFYGPFNPMPCTRSGYRRLARRVGFDLVVDEDITAHTLPTYPAILRMRREAGHPTGERATSLMQWVSRHRWIRYRLLKFTKPLARGA